MAWADTSTVTASKMTSLSANWQGSAGETWAVSVNEGALGTNLMNGYAQCGTTKSPSKSVVVSTSGIQGTITSIVVDCASYNGLGSISATVGGSAFGTQSQSIPKWVVTDNVGSGGKVTFSNTTGAKGEIVITMTNGEGGRAMYIKSITVTYTQSSEPYISAPDVVELAYDATEGEIEVSIENAAVAILGGSVEEGCDWITDLNTSVSPVTFKTTVNESSDPREATITFTGGGASKVVTIIQAGAPLIYDNIPDLFAAATGSSTLVNVAFDNWVVTGVNGNQLFVSDGTNGFIVYQKEHGFSVGNILSGTAECNLVLYNKSAELTGLTATTEGLTVSTGGTVTPVATTIDALGAVNTGSVVTLNNLTYDGANLVDANDNTIQPYSSLYNVGTFVEGKVYNVTGVFLLNNDSKRILPRSAADIEEIPTSVTVVIGETGYATLYYENLNLEIPEGVIATVVSDIEGTKLVEDEVTDIIPAGTGVILKGTPNTTYIFNVVSGTVTPVGSMTGGFDEDSKINGDPENIYYYKFSTKNGKVGFWWGAEDGGLFVSKAHKIFLAVPKSYFDTVSSAKNFISFFGEDNGVTTSINNVEKIAEGAAIYNLNGVRVNKMQKGVYVVNGKKVVIK